jgi:hypothetical protein
VFYLEFIVKTYHAFYLKLNHGRNFRKYLLVVLDVV